MKIKDIPLYGGGTTLVIIYRFSAEEEVTLPIVTLQNIVRIYLSVATPEVLNNKVLKIIE